MRKSAPDVSRFNDISQLPISATFGGHGAEMLYCGVLGEKWWRNYLHVHSFFEVSYVYAGSGTFRLKEERFPLSPGDTFIARPGEPHEIVSSRKRPLGIYFWAYALLDAVEPAAGGSDAALSKLMRLFPTTPRAIVRAPAIHPLLRLMTEEIDRRAPGYVQMLNALFAKVIIDTVRAVSPNVVPGEMAGQRNATAAAGLVQTAEQYLRDNLERRLALHDVAAQVNLSERQLSRLFRQFTGTSVLAHLTDLRIKKASHLLLNTELAIKQVAAAVGYPDTHYFTTLFGRVMGTTPAAFRDAGGTEFLTDAGRASPENRARRRGR